MAYRRILTIQDISCLGQCSMTVALPILSACGHETCILPTALLSTHTGGFGRPSVTQLAGAVPGILQHWQEQKIRFDAIYTGYLGSVEAIRETGEIARTLLAPGGRFIVDPAMADHGRLYSGFDTAYAEAMKALCRKADLILPNMTEAAILSGLPYRTSWDDAYIHDLLQGLDHPAVILTGACASEGKTGVSVLNRGKRWDYCHRKYERSYHGTGDLFASCFVGALLRDKTIEEAVTIAADTVCESIGNTIMDPDHWYGVKFETAIPGLLARL